MFKLCFGKGKSDAKRESNIRKKFEMKAEEEKNQIEYIIFFEHKYKILKIVFLLILIRFRIKIKYITIEMENYKHEISINDELVLLFKNALDEFTKILSNNSNNIVSILRKENKILNQSIDSLNSKIQITESSVKKLIYILYKSYSKVELLLIFGFRHTKTRKKSITFSMKIQKFIGLNLKFLL